MPVIKPEIQKILRQAGLAPEASNSETPLTEKLDGAGMNIDEAVEELVNLARNAGNDNIRLNALRDVLKLHGALKETAPVAPSFTIVINESSLPSQNPQLDQKPTGVPSGVNPILLPRQLLKSLADKEPKETIQ